MAVDPALWDAFHEAKDALLSALRDSSPSIQNVLLSLPADRATTRAAIATAVASLEQICEMVKSIKNEFSRMSSHLQETITRAHHCLPPIGALPVEVLQEVFLQVAGPRDHGMIRTLVSVNRLWREAALDMRSLFSCPEWCKWSTDLLELWCSRARSVPLEVQLEDADMIAIARNGCKRWLRLLQSTKTTWGSLHFECQWRRNDSNGEIDAEVHAAALWLFKDTLPALTGLRFGVPEVGGWSGMSVIVPLSAPNLRTLQYSGIALQPTESLDNLDHLTVLKGRVMVSWVPMLRMTPALKYLKIISHNADYLATHQDELELPYLRHMLFCADGSSSRLKGALRLISFPILKQLIVIRQPANESVFQAITDRMPQLTSLTMKRIRSFVDVAEAVHVLGSKVMIVPLLEAVDLSDVVKEGSLDDAARTDEKALEYEASVLQMVTTRKLRRLALPCLSRDCANEVLKHVKSLQVSVWSDDNVMPELPFPPF